MAQSPKIWRKKDGQWVKTTPDVTKADVGLGNVENFTHTNSATDGSSSKYATGAAAKQAYDRATQALNKANSAASFGSVQLGPEIRSDVLWSKRDEYNGSQPTDVMGSYFNIAKDRSDIFLCGVHRKNWRNYTAIRARYRRL